MEKIIKYTFAILTVVTLLSGIFFVLDFIWDIIGGWLSFKIFITSVIFTTIFAYLHDLTN